MIRKLVALVLVVGLGLPSMPAIAGSRTVLVLPVGGTAAPATREKISTSLQKMARVLDGDVQAGDATFTDTATAIGCDPATPACVENVRATLAVDELVYGTADDEVGNITLVVKRYQQGKQVREMTISLTATDPAQKVEVELLPVFSTAPMLDEPGEGDPLDPTLDPTLDPDQPVEVVGPEIPKVSRRERNISIAIMAGGGVMLALGLSLWSSKSGLQDDIDNHPTRTVADFAALEELEDKASSRAWAGNFFVLAGLAVATYGGWRFYKDREAHRVTITPAPIEGGAAVVLTIGGGL